MDFLVDISVEREEGMSVSKDALAEEFMGAFTGDVVGVDLSEYLVEDDNETPEDQFDITTIDYLGTKKGKPLQFRIVLEGESGYPEAVIEALEDMFDGEMLDYEDSSYSICGVSAREER